MPDALWEHGITDWLCEIISLHVALVITLSLVHILNYVIYIIRIRSCIHLQLSPHE